MIARAIENRWLTEDLRPMAIEAIRAGLLSAKQRERQAAVDALIKMEAQNQKDEHHKAVKALEQLNNQLATILGPVAAIASGDVASGPAEASSDTESQ